MASAFIDANYLTGCYDVRKICQLLSDTNVPIPSANLETNGTLTQILNEAASMVLMACEQGERYNESDLFNLVVPVNGVYPTGAYVLMRLNADIAFALLVSRRAQGAADIDRQCPRYGQAMAQLEQLRLGGRIIPGVDGAGDAGLPGLGNSNPALNPYPVITSTRLAWPLFPVRHPHGQGYPGQGCW